VVTRSPSRLGTLLRNDAGRQTVLLYGAQLLSMALNFGFTVIVGRAMTQEDFGVYSFCVASVLLFLSYLFEFGVFSAGGRLLAIAPGREEERRLLGALCIAGLGIGALFSLVIAASGPVVEVFLDQSGHADASVTGTLLAAASLAAAIPLQQLAEQACQGTNRIGALAALRLALPIASISIVSALYAATGTLTPAPAICAYLGGNLVAACVVLAMLKPSFSLRRDDFDRIRAAVREYGFDLYAGRVVGMMSTRLDQLLIPFFVGPRRWGAYRIAQQVSEPVASVARTLATTRFKAFANAREVPVAFERWNMAIVGAAAAALAGVGWFVFEIVFPNKYRNALPLFVPFAFATFFAGLLQPYNMFLTAHGRGRSLRNISLALGVLNLAGLYAFTRRYGLAGAAWFAVAAMAFNFALHLYYYRKLLKELEKQTDAA
jgi:O-antigen/teichoic acid export membrane protein